jgi:hypothetical protein
MLFTGHKMVFGKQVEKQNKQQKQRNKLRGLSPRANYTDRASKKYNDEVLTKFVILLPYNTDR